MLQRRRLRCWVGQGHAYHIVARSQLAAFPYDLAGARCKFDLINVHRIGCAGITYNIQVILVKNARLRPRDSAIRIWKNDVTCVMTANGHYACVKRPPNLAAFTLEVQRLDRQREQFEVLCGFDFEQLYSLSSLVQRYR
jgi:hypothetical protein